MKAAIDRIGLTSCCWRAAGVYFVGRYGSESAGLNQPHYRFVMPTSRPVGNLRGAGRTNDHG